MPTFRQAREFLLANRTNYDKALAGFQWPEPVRFNWALDWFDAELAHAAPLGSMRGWVPSRPLVQWSVVK